MLSLSKIESDLKAAIKLKDQIVVGVLRGLKARYVNEQIAKTRELSEEEMIGLIRSEIKKRKEAAEQFEKGGRAELAEKERRESLVLEKYLPAQLNEGDLAKLADEIIGANSFTSADFGKAMGALKARVGAGADRATMARILKEKLKS